MLLVKDKAGMKSWFESEAQKPHKRIIVSHGDIIEAPAQALRVAAANL